MASITHVSRAEAVPHRDRAAVAAFPVDVSFAVLCTFSLASAVRLELAVFAA